MDEPKHVEGQVDMKHEFEKRINGATLDDTWRNIGEIIGQILDNYTDRKVVPAQLSSEGLEMERKARKKAVELMLASVSGGQTIEDMDKAYADTKDLRNRLRLFDDRDFTSQINAIYEARFKRMISAVNSKEEAQLVWEKIDGRYKSVAGIPSYTGSQLKDLLSQTLAKKGL